MCVQQHRDIARCQTTISLNPPKCIANMHFHMKIAFTNIRYVHFHIVADVPSQFSSTNKLRPHTNSTPPDKYIAFCLTLVCCVPLITISPSTTAHICTTHLSPNQTQHSTSRRATTTITLHVLWGASTGSGSCICMYGASFPMSTTVGVAFKLSKT